MKRLVAITISLFMVAPGVSAQQCSLHSTCGPGQLCSGSGTCQSLEAVLGADGGTIYWVDRAVGRDSNPGTKTKPFATIGATTGRDFLQPGDAVVVRKGTYYEEIRPKAGGNQNAFVTYVAYPGETVVVSGAEPLQLSWTKYAGQIWRATWPHGHQSDPGEDRATSGVDETYRREVLIANGQMLRAVLKLGDLEPGTFYVAGPVTSPKGQPIYAWLPGGINPNNATLETSRTGALFGPNGCGGVGYLRVIGFTFRHAGQYGLKGAVCGGERGSWIEHITVEWTNGTGVQLSGPGMTLRDVRVVNNALLGVKGNTCDGCLIEYVEAAGNNWKRHTWGGRGGMSFLRTSNSVFRHLNIHDNNGYGLWFDYYNQDNLIEKNRIDNNRGVGIFLEYNSHGNVVRNNVISRTRNYFGAYQGAAIEVSGSSNTAFVYNTVINNGSGLLIDKDPRHLSQGTDVYNNLFINNRHASSPSYRDVDLNLHVETNGTHVRLEGNAYWHRTVGQEEKDDVTFRIKEASGFGNGDFYTNDIQAWRSYTGFDATSRITTLAQPTVADLNDPGSGWLLVDDSQYRGMAVGMPGRIDPVTDDFFGNPRPASGGDPGAHQYGSDDEAPTSPPDDPPSDPPGDSPGADAVAAYDFMRGADDRLLYDGAGNDHHGELLLDPAWGSDGLRFDSGVAAQRVGLPDGLTVSGAGTLLIAYRALDATQPGKHAFYASGTAGASPGSFQLDHDGNGQIRLLGTTSTGSRYAMTLGSADTAWHVFAVRWSPATGTLTAFVDGAAVATRTGMQAGDVRVVDGGAFGVNRALNRTSDGILGYAGVYDEPLDDGDVAAASSEIDDLIAARLDAAGKHGSAGSVLLSEPTHPEAFALHPSYPNPFNPSTQIAYALPEAAHARLVIYDVTGRQVRVLVDAPHAPGRYTASFEAEGLPSGVYMYRLQAGSFVATGRATLLK